MAGHVSKKSCKSKLLLTTLKIAGQNTFALSGSTQISRVELFIMYWRLNVIFRVLDLKMK